MKNELNKILNSTISVAEKAAIACYDWIGKGHSDLADQAAVTAMRSELNELNINGTIVIGEGERDKAPMLYIGEKVGKGGLEVDIALDPLEGTTLCAHAKSNSYAVIAFSSKNSFLHAPDVYMDKIAVGPNLPKGVIDLDNSVEQNLKNLAKAKNKAVSDLVITILERKRHQELITKCRESGAKIRLIQDGDIAAIIEVNQMKCDNAPDIYIGTGGAPEGVLAAASMKSTGGQMMARLIFNDNYKQVDRAKKMGITDINKKYDQDSLVKDDAIFIASAVTDGDLLGVRKYHNSIFVNSIVMNSSQKMIRTIKTQYKL
ncbi:class II fructose-bisphosphatase [Flavobacteriaceae bacterium]|nr:class II fructose-bisphosphatase [Flavobacteriaceae bacterium]